MATSNHPPRGRPPTSPTMDLPSIIALSGEFGVAAVTAREALTALQREGLVESRTGWGTFVRE
jgi:GntR family transcriptional regulator